MLTLFTVPRSFSGKYAQIQLNALKSWQLLHPHIQIILFGDEPGTHDTARAFKVDHISRVAKTKFGTPLLDDVFRKARDHARFPLLMYTNSDMVYLNDLVKNLKLVSYPQFLLIGRRYNLDISGKINFGLNWQDKLRSQLKSSHLFKYGALDYFIFPRTINFHMPPFAVGRTAWDNWVVYKTRSLRVPVIDASNVITAIHQNHDYDHATGLAAQKFKYERDQNWQLVDDRRRFFNARDADYILTAKGLQSPPISLKRIIRTLEKFPVLHKRFGFMVEPLVLIIRGLRYLRDKLRGDGQLL